MLLNQLIGSLRGLGSVRVGLALNRDRASIHDLFQDNGALAGLLHFGLGGFNALRVLLDVLLGAAQSVDGPIHLAAVCTLFQLKQIDFRLKLHALQQHWVARCHRSHFSHADRIGVFKVHGERAVILADTVDGPQLGRVQVPHLGVYRALGGIGQDFHLKVRDEVWIGLVGIGRRGKDVALSDDPALALLDVAWLPRHIDVMQADKTVLHVGAGAHSGGGPDQHTDFPASDSIKQSLLLLIRAGLLDKTDLIGRNTHGNQVVLDLLIGIPSTLLGDAELFDFVGIVLFQAFCDAFVCVGVFRHQCGLTLGAQIIVFLDGLGIAL